MANPRSPFFIELSQFSDEAVSIPCSAKKENGSFLGRSSTDTLALLIARTVKQFTRLDREVGQLLEKYANIDTVYDTVIGLTIFPVIKIFGAFQKLPTLVRQN